MHYNNSKLGVNSSKKPKQSKFSDFHGVCDKNRFTNSGKALSYAYFFKLKCYHDYACKF